MDAETIAVWLIGAGSLMIVLGQVVVSQRPSEGMTFRGPLSSGPERLCFAIEGAGSALVAGGGVVLAVANLPPVWVLFLFPTAYGLVHILAAWKLRQYWRFREAEAVRAAAGDGATELQHQMAKCATTCASWRWCLLHPFNGEYWPQAVLRSEGE